MRVKDEGGWDPTQIRKEDFNSSTVGPEWVGSLRPAHIVQSIVKSSEEQPYRRFDTSQEHCILFGDSETFLTGVDPYVARQHFRVEIIESK